MVYLNYNFFGQTPKSSIKVLFKFNLIHDALYCCVRYTYIKHQGEISTTYHQKYCSKGNG